MKAKPQWTWNTQGIENNAATIWSVVRNHFTSKSLDGETYGIFSGTFIVDPSGSKFEMSENNDKFWQLSGDEHNVKSSFLVGRVESRPLELVEKLTNLKWEGKFLGDACTNEKEEFYREDYSSVFTTCNLSKDQNIWIYRTPHVAGYYRLGDIALHKKPEKATGS